jgi:hypothetical protein
MGYFARGSLLPQRSSSDQGHVGIFPACRDTFQELFVFEVTEIMFVYGDTPPQGISAQEQSSVPVRTMMDSSPSWPALSQIARTLSMRAREISFVYQGNLLPRGITAHEHSRSVRTMLESSPAWPAICKNIVLAGTRPRSQ